MIPGWLDKTLAAQRVTLNGSAPRCDHLGELTTTPAPLTGFCTECLRSGDGWTALLMCLTCGWVACSDDSVRKHARGHYQETDHPVAERLEPGSTWRWCYVHRRLV